MGEEQDAAPSLSRRLRGWVLGGGALVLLVIAALVVGVVGLAGRDGDEPSAAPTAPSTPPPFPTAPYAVADGASLTVPEETRFAQGTFWAEAGAEYVVTMDLRSTKPEGSGGRSMYLGVTLSCSPQAGGPGISAGGTQNMLTGEETSYRNQGLISVDEAGGVDCSIKLSAPYDDVASDGTTFPVEATWEVRRVEAAAEAQTESVLPRTIAAGATEDVLTAELPVDEAGDGVEALSSLHLTACTIVNGSREDGRAWCPENALDEAGSTATLQLRAELLDEGGAVCTEFGAETTPADHIDLYRHHRLLSIGLAATMPEQPCGKTVRVVARVTNDGPAPLVVHRTNSTLLVDG